MNDIKIGVVGAVVNGKHPNMRIRIEDDLENTGGYMIYQWWEGSIPIDKRRFRANVYLDFASDEIGFNDKTAA